MLDNNDKTTETLDIPELSRPRRQYKEDHHATQKPSGRKRIKAQQISLRTNWQSPFLWSQIELATKKAGKPWQQARIVKLAKQANPKDFSKLTEQVVGRWMDQEAKKSGISKWKDSVLARVAKGNSPGGQNTRSGILVSTNHSIQESYLTKSSIMSQEPYPDLRKKIELRLQSLREAGVALSLLTIRGIMVAYIDHDAPELFERVLSDGSKFKCADSFVRKYLRDTMGWSERCATRAAQKLPADYEAILHAAFLREAYVIRDHAIPTELRVNTDQTQTIYQQGTKSTWTKKGEKQVSTLGQEEKRAFTLVPSISASGVLLPMQAIYFGKTTQSVPNAKAAKYDEAVELGFVMLPSKSDTYWSTHETMHALVDTILAPYLDAQKVKLSLPQSQCSIWKIDCWSVHKSVDFMSWMEERHANIIVLFIPGGCTGVFQPLDVAIQRPLKQSVKRSAHRDIVDEATAQLVKGVPADELKLNTTLGVLRNRSVGWIVNAIHDINKKELILKVRS